MRGNSHAAPHASREGLEDGIAVWCELFWGSDGVGSAMDMARQFLSMVS